MERRTAVNIVLPRAPEKYIFSEGTDDYEKINKQRLEHYSMQLMTDVVPNFCGIGELM